MIYCKKCLIPDTRPGGEFSDGLCLPCYYLNSNQEINYPAQLKILKRVYWLSRKGQKNKGAFDCIVGVSGGKDSSRQAHWVRDRLGLRPLLVCVAYPPRQMSSVGASNLSNLIDMGFDMVIVTPAASGPSSKERFLITVKVR